MNPSFLYEKMCILLLEHESATNEDQFVRIWLFFSMHYVTGT